MAAASLPVPSAPPSAPPVVQHPLRERNFRMLWVGSGFPPWATSFIWWRCRGWYCS
jgi:hypothetical protein